MVIKRTPFLAGFFELISAKILNISPGPENLDIHFWISWYPSFLAKEESLSGTRGNKGTCRGDERSEAKTWQALRCWLCAFLRPCWSLPFSRSVCLNSFGILVKFLTFSNRESKKQSSLITFHKLGLSLGFLNYKGHNTYHHFNTQHSAWHMLCDSY